MIHDSLLATLATDTGRPDLIDDFIRAVLDSEQWRKATS